MPSFLILNVPTFSPTPTMPLATCSTSISALPKSRATMNPSSSSSSLHVRRKYGVLGTSASSPSMRFVADHVEFRDDGLATGKWVKQILGLDSLISVKPDLAIGVKQEAIVVRENPSTTPLQPASHSLYQYINSRRERFPWVLSECT